MKRINWRFVITGGVAIVLAVAFFVFMKGFAPQSTDPIALMKIVGSTSGVVGAIGFVLAVLGFFGKRFRG